MGKININICVEDVVHGTIRRMVVWRENVAAGSRKPMASVTLSNWVLHPAGTYEVVDFERNLVVHKGLLEECMIFSDRHYRQ